MHAVNMGRKRIMVGAIILILLLLFMNECSSSSSHDADTPSKSDTISRPNNMTVSANSRWARRILGTGDGPLSHKTTYHFDNHRHKVTHEGSIDRSVASSSNMTLPDNVPQGKDPGDKLQTQECLSSTAAHCTNNGSTSIDPRYGVEKRLVPTGPNPLHN